MEHNFVLCRKSEIIFDFNKQLDIRGAVGNVDSGPICGNGLFKNVSLYTYEFINYYNAITLRFSFNSYSL